MMPGSGLIAEQIAKFERDGYLIIPNALPEETVSQLLKETHSLLDDFSLEDHPMTKFSTGESSEHVGDDYFLSSGDKIRFFFEEGMPQMSFFHSQAMNRSNRYVRQVVPMKMKIK
jgi:phytanoyl-CoA hydroxylase